MHNALQTDGALDAASSPHRRLRLTCITIGYANKDQLIDTLLTIEQQTVPPHQHLVIASGLTPEEEKQLVAERDFPCRHFVFNQDAGIYNAMNIGIRRATGNAVFFLNSGDYLLHSDVLSFISQLWEPDKCFSFPVVQVTSKRAFLHPGPKRRKLLEKVPSHQGFIAPLPEKPIKRTYFCERKSISSDSEWVREKIKIYGIIPIYDPVSIFSLGGISNLPNFDYIKTQLKDKQFAKVLKGVPKVMAYKILGSEMYFLALACFTKKKVLNHKEKQRMRLQ